MNEKIPFDCLLNRGIEKNALCDAISMEYWHSIEASLKWLAYHAYRAKKTMEIERATEPAMFVSLLMDTVHLTEKFEQGLVMD